MTTPAYSHTYTYSRPGVGDVIALGGAGHPYTAVVTTPANWSANLWYATDPLASVHDAAAWTALNAGVVPGTAAQIAVDVLAAPRTPVSGRLLVTVSSANYKAATGLRYTNSGAHQTVFSPIQSFDPPGSPRFFYDMSDLDTLWLDQAGTMPITGNGDGVMRVTDKGSEGEDILMTQSGLKAVPYDTGMTGAGGLGMLNFNGLDDSFISGFTMNQWQTDATVLLVFNQTARDGNENSAFLHADANKSGAVLIFNETVGDKLSVEIGSTLDVSPTLHPLDTMVGAWHRAGTVDGARWSWGTRDDSNHGASPALTVSASASVGADQVASQISAGLRCMILYPTALSDADLTLLEEYATNAHGVTWA